MNYRPEIDGLRALAVVSVILFHADFAMFSGGFVGVDIFFVISGYLITSIIISDLSQQKFSIVRFYERRARRILPALFLVIAVSTAVAWTIMVPTQFKAFAQSVVSVVLFSSNIFFWLKSGYFDAPALETPLLHTWTLSVEEQFYIVFPLVLLVLWPLRKAVVLIGIIALGLVSFALAEWGSRVWGMAAFYLLPFRAWELMAGAACAVLLRYRPPRQKDLPSVAGLAMLVLAVFAFEETTRFPSVFTLLPVVGTCLLVVYCGGNARLGRLLASRPLVAVGLVSYSAYLWHQPMFAFARLSADTPPPGWVMLALSAAAVALAALSWRFVEQPFRTRRVGRTVIFAGATAVGAVFLAVGLAGHITDGLPGRFDLDAIQEAYVASANGSPRRKACHTDGADYLPPRETCVLGGDVGTVAVLGDSHGVELAYALGKALGARGRGVRQLTFSSCRPSAKTGGFDTPCEAWTRQAINYIKSDLDIAHVVVSYRLILSRSGERLNNLVAMLTELSETKNVVYVLQAPEPQRAMLNAVLELDQTKRPVEGRSRAWWDDQLVEARNALGAIEGVRVVDPTDAFCDRKLCYMGRDGRSFYFDNHHPSLTGAEMIAEVLLPHIAADEASADHPAVLER